MMLKDPINYAKLTGIYGVAFSVYHPAPSAFYRIDNEFSGQG
jgi:hypothetical protein